MHASVDDNGACYTAAPGIGAEAAANRRRLAEALVGAGLVNHPTRWWHWSYGDRYWAFVTAAPHARYGPVMTTPSPITGHARR